MTSSMFRRRLTAQDKRSYKVITYCPRAEQGTIFFKKSQNHFHIQIYIGPSILADVPPPPNPLVSSTQRKEEKEQSSQTRSPPP